MNTSPLLPIQGLPFHLRDTLQLVWDQISVGHEYRTMVLNYVSRLPIHQRQRYTSLQIEWARTRQCYYCEILRLALKRKAVLLKIQAHWRSAGERGEIYPMICCELARLREVNLETGEAILQMIKFYNVVIASCGSLQVLLYLWNLIYALHRDSQSVVEGELARFTRADFDPFFIAFLEARGKITEQQKEMGIGRLFALGIMEIYRTINLRKELASTKDSLERRIDFLQQQQSPSSSASSSKQPSKHARSMSKEIAAKPECTPNKQQNMWSGQGRIRKNLRTSYTTQSGIQEQSRLGFSERAGNNSSSGAGRRRMELVRLEPININIERTNHPKSIIDLSNRSTLTEFQPLHTHTPTLHPLEQHQNPFLRNESSKRRYDFNPPGRGGQRAPGHIRNKVIRKARLFSEETDAGLSQDAPIRSRQLTQIRPSKQQRYLHQERIHRDAPNIPYQRRKQMGGQRRDADCQTSFLTIRQDSLSESLYVQGGESPQSQEAPPHRQFSFHP